MNKRSALLPWLLVLLLPLAACQKQASTGATPGDGAPPATPASTASPATPGAPVAGVDYYEIPGGRPYAPQDGKVEVVEAFGYTCPHCAHFEPILTAWKATLPAGTRLVQVPAPFGGPWDNYARAYFAAEALGLAEQTHDAVFDAIHNARSLPPNASVEQLAAFYAQHGANADTFASTMRSFAVDARLGHARQFLAGSEVAGAPPIGTPMMIVNGKYRVDAGTGYEKMLDTVDQLVARESAAGG